MNFEFSDEQKSLEKELTEYFSNLMTPQIRGSLDKEGEGGETYRKVVRQMGMDGMLGIGWPVEFGGGGKSALDQFILFDVIRRARAPFPFVTVNTVGPTLMRFGTKAQQEEFLPKILKGEVIFAIGYTEPEAGTDLAQLRTRAIRDGDFYTVNGAKVFTSGADMADYIWLACRTDPNAPTHKGISILIVPTRSQGFKATIINTVGELTTCATYYDDVRVPVENLVGGENEGWKMITTQLNHERVGLSAWGGLAHRLFDDLIAWAKSTPASGEVTWEGLGAGSGAGSGAGLGAGSGEGAIRGDTDLLHTSGDLMMIDLDWVQIELGRAFAILEAVKILNWKMASNMSKGELGPADSSAVKVFGTEELVHAYHIMLGILGSHGYIRPGSTGAALQGELERAARGAQINTFGGGVNEVQREIVAWLGLKMARGARR